MGLQGPMLALTCWGFSGKKLLGLILLSFDDDFCGYYTIRSDHMFSLSSLLTRLFRGIKQADADS